MNEFAFVCHLLLHVRFLVLLNALPLWKVRVRVTHAVRTWGLRVGYSMEPLCFGDWDLIVSLGPWLLIMAARLGTISTFGSQQHWFEHMYFRVHYLYSSFFLDLSIWLWGSARRRSIVWYLICTLWCTPDGACSRTLFSCVVLCTLNLDCASDCLYVEPVYNVICYFAYMPLIRPGIVFSSLR